MISIYTLFIVINILLANVDNLKLESGKKILHGVNGLVYSILVLLAFLNYHNYLMVASLFLLRGVVFDISLNLLRGLKWNYISTSTTSIVDRLERKVFGMNGTVMYVSYSIALLIGIILSISL